jgi:hypothetical protein
MKGGKIKSTPNSALNVTGGRGVQEKFSKENCFMTDLYSAPGFSSTLSHQLYLIFWKSISFAVARSGVKVLLRQLELQLEGGENLPLLNWRVMTPLHLLQVKFIPLTKGFTTLILTTVPRTDTSFPAK